MRTGYEIREGSKILAERIEAATCTTHGLSSEEERKQQIAHIIAVVQKAKS